MTAPKNHLLLIAINEYRYWRPLRGPAKDAEALKAVLYGRYGFDHDRTVELRDAAATSAAILGAFRGLKDAPAEDQLLLYYAGHGYTDGFDGTGFWIPHDAETDELRRAGWIPNASVRGALTALPFRHILLVCDSCFSGDMLDEQRDLGVERTPGYLEHAACKRSREVLTSGASEPVADVNLGGHSAFAFHLIDTLKSSQDIWLDPLRLYDHIRCGVRGQMPLYGSLDGSGHQRGGTFLFARQERETRPRDEDRPTAPTLRAPDIENIPPLYAAYPATLYGGSPGIGLSLLHPQPGQARPNRKRPASAGRSVADTQGEATRTMADVRVEDIGGLAHVASDVLNGAMIFATIWTVVWLMMWLEEHARHYRWLFSLKGVPRWPVFIIALLTCGIVHETIRLLIERTAAIMGLWKKISPTGNKVVKQALCNHCNRLLSYQDSQGNWIAHDDSKIERVFDLPSWSKCPHCGGAVKK